MRTALTDDKFLDDRATNRTKFSFPIIHAKMILELAAAINPVKARTVAADSLLQCGADSCVQVFSLFL